MASNRLNLSPTFTFSNSPITSTSLTSTSSYILHLASTLQLYAASLSSPSNTLQLFDKSSLRVLSSLNGHDRGVTYLRNVHLGQEGEALMSSGRDGCIKIWDLRSGDCIKMSNTADTRALLCCDMSMDGMLVAAGSELQGDDSVITYWDIRQPTIPMMRHTQTHSDDITSVHFSPTSQMLLSSSSDGLLSLSSPQETDEDEAVVHVGNMECSVSQSGFYQGGKRVWSASDMETFALWSDELDCLAKSDIRAPTLHTGMQGQEWITDYLVSCHSVPSEGKLATFVGSNEGDVALLTPDVSSSEPGMNWTLERTWVRGHVGVVRQALWDVENNYLLTGGEDSMLNLWQCPSIPFKGSDTQDEMEVDV